MSTLRLICQTCSGIVFEYCETSLFLFYASAISRDLLPNSSVIIMYVLHAIAAIARPLGAYIFGRIGDRDGAIIAIRYSAILMVISSGFMSIVPGYDTVGNLAIILLLILRSVQMLSVGGELNFAAILLINRFKYKNLASGLIWSATSLGWLLAFLLYQLLGVDNWRTAFMCTSCVGLITIPIRGTASGLHSHNTTIRVDTDLQNVSNAQLITFLLSASVAAFTYYALQYSRQHVSDIYVVAAYCIAFIMNIVAGYMIDILGMYIAACGIVILFFVVLALSPQQAFLLYPALLALWKAPTHAIVQRMFKSNACSQSGFFYALGTSIAGQGSMLVCGLLDQYYAGLSILWPIFALIAAIYAYWLVWREDVI